MKQFVIALGGQSGVLVGHLHATLAEIYQAPEYSVFGADIFAPEIVEKNPLLTVHRTLYCAGQLAHVGRKSFPDARLYVGVQGSLVPPYPAEKPFVGVWAGNDDGTAGVASLSLPVY